MYILKEKKTNHLAELSDPDLEREFFRHYIENSMKFLRPMVLFLGVFNMLFIIPDYYLVQNERILFILGARAVFLLLVVFLYLGLGRIKDYKKLAFVITFYEILAILTFLYIFNQYESPNFLIQAFGVMVIIICVFMIPNRWINMVFASVLVSVGFVGMSTYYSVNIPIPEFSAGIVYIVIVIFLCSIGGFRNQYFRRIEFVYAREMLRLSTTDYLTGISNRARFDEELQRWIGQSKRYGVTFSIAIFDFDNFKVVNDTYGHLTGDRVIRETVELVKKNIREADFFARWGGEEFVLILPHTDLTDAAELANRIRSQIAEYNFKNVGRVTCSFGVAQFSPEEEMENVLQRADKNLYRAKREGKNRVVW